MSRAVILTAIRTPIGDMGGSLRSVSATMLAATAITGLLDRTGVDPSEVDDVVLGQCYPNGEAPAIGRVAALDAGLPVTVPGMQIDRRCASGLEAVVQAHGLVESGQAEVVVAGGVESMSNAEFYTTDLRPRQRSSITLNDRLKRGRVTAGGKNYPVPGGMIETAENLRRRYDISRREQDDLALESNRRAVGAAESGRFVDETIPVNTGAALVNKDEHPRAQTSRESLAALSPVMGEADAEATVTAGNASGQNDGAAVCLVTTEERARELGTEMGLRILAVGRAGVAPAEMGIGPVPSTKLALERCGRTLADMELIELNEAFAAQALAVCREWGFTDRDHERLNVNGSGISLGHPVGATGCRILATLMSEMRRRGSGLALETICAGGGQGISVVFEAWQ